MAASSQKNSVREKAQAMRQQQASSDRRMTMIVISVVTVIVLAIVAAVGIVVSKQIAANNAAKSVDPAVALGELADSKPILYSHLGVGQIDESLPTVTEYFDYSCHACADVEVLFGSTLKEGADNGEYNIEYQSVRTVDAAYQQSATAASLVVAQKAPEQWADFHHALLAYFATQYKAQDGSVVNDESRSWEQVKQIAAEVNVPAEVIDTFPHGAVVDAYLTGSTETWRNATIEGRDRLGTPEFVVDGKSVTLQGTTAEELLNSLRSSLGL